MNPGADWIEQGRRLLDDPAADAVRRGAPTARRPAAHAADCRWCPVLPGGGRRARASGRR